MLVTVEVSRQFLTNEYSLSITPFPLKHSSDHAIFFQLVFHGISLHKILGGLFMCVTIICFVTFVTTG